MNWVNMYVAALILVGFMSDDVNESHLGAVSLSHCKCHMVHVEFHGNCCLHYCISCFLAESRCDLFAVLSTDIWCMSWHHSAAYIHTYMY